MIRLEKLTVPENLAERIAERTRRYLELTAAGEPVPDSLAGAYKDPHVKALLRAETADKCAYCESKVPHIDYGDVEHIISKVHRPELRYVYSNLTYSCGVCNTKKGDYHSDETPLLNPYEDQPTEHLAAFGPMVMRLPTSNRGLVTQKRLQLNRAELIEKRSERLEQVGVLMDQWMRTTDAAVRAVLEEQLRQECEADKEYAFVVRSYVEKTRELIA